MQSWELTTFPPKRICRSPVSDDHRRPPNSGPHPPPQKRSLKTVTALMPLCIMSFSIILYIKLLAATGGASAARMKLGTSRVVEGICRWENLTWRWPLGSIGVGSSCGELGTAQPKVLMISSWPGLWAPMFLRPKMASRSVQLTAGCMGRVVTVTNRHTHTMERQGICNNGPHQSRAYVVHVLRPNMVR